MSTPPRYLAILIALLAALLMGACGGDGGSDEPRVTTEETSEDSAATYSENGVTFEYPANWDEFPSAASATTAGSNELWSATVGPDRTNLVNVTAYELNIEVNDENLESIEAELNDVITGVVEDAGGQITAGPTAGEVAGFPAYTYVWEDVEVDGEPKDSSAYFVFNGKIEYFFNCQFSDETAEEVQAGCDQILDTFSVSTSA